MYHLLKLNTQDKCAPLFLSSPQLLSPQSESVVLPLKRIAYDTCCFCAEGIIILHSLMVPFKLSVVFCLVGGLIYSLLGVPVSCYAVQLSAPQFKQGPAPHTT